MSTFAKALFGAKKKLRDFVLINKNTDKKTNVTKVILLKIIEMYRPMASNFLFSRDSDSTKHVTDLILDLRVSTDLYLIHGGLQKLVLKDRLLSSFIGKGWWWENVDTYHSVKLRHLQELELVVSNPRLLYWIAKIAYCGSCSSVLERVSIDFHMFSSACRTCLDKDLLDDVGLSAALYAIVDCCVMHPFANTKKLRLKLDTHSNEMIIPICQWITSHAHLMPSKFELIVDLPRTRPLFSCNLQCTIQKVSSPTRSWFACILSSGDIPELSPDVLALFHLVKCSVTISEYMLSSICRHLLAFSNFFSNSKKKFFNCCKITLIKMMPIYFSCYASNEKKKLINSF
ncbi:hypothetical protein RFI_31628 [Reticulomyxa filosa]|uniref:Uncharacterized protein n=1 Tax=Reticulomyxa filosa TaxID=46433 RepID=X6LXA3_RETFI|nr:hypothetical protein RFI_31628 [Reticulomyxa filosa]|eukprot:ETO05767.1 hypothetical protein RFI_31628 [Reticulomyxa filosa]